MLDNYFLMVHDANTTHGDIIYSMLKKFVLIIIFAFVLALIIAYSRGYRVNIWQNEVTSNGLVAVTSSPKGAKIFIDGNLKGVTDTTVYLQPGTYDFTIIKDGYFSWKKTVTVQGEIVHSVDATLYPINSSLNPLTNIGVVRSIKFGAGEQKALIFSKKIAETSQDIPFAEPTSAEEKKDGLFVFDPNVRAVTLFSSLTSIAEYGVFPVDINPDRVWVVFSPNYEQAVLFNMTDIEYNEWNQEKPIGTEFSPSSSYPKTYSSAFLISLNTYNLSPLDVTGSAPTLIDAWTQKKVANLDALLSGYKKNLAEFLKLNTVLVDMSQDKNRIMYVATAEAKLSKILKNPLIGSNQTPDIRSTTIHALYVYDIKEDRNYQIFEDYKKAVNDLGMIFLHPNSKNVVFGDENGISISDFDGINEQRLYSGPFNKNFLAISNDGRLIILTSLNTSHNAAGDLYAIGIR